MNLSFSFLLSSFTADILRERSQSADSGNTRQQEVEEGGAPGVAPWWRIWWSLRTTTQSNSFSFCCFFNWKACPGGGVGVGQLLMLKRETCLGISQKNMGRRNMRKLRNNLIQKSQILQ